MPSPLNYALLRPSWTSLQVLAACSRLRFANDFNRPKRFKRSSLLKTSSEVRQVHQSAYRSSESLYPGKSPEVPESPPISPKHPAGHCFPQACPMTERTKHGRICFGHSCI